MYRNTNRLIEIELKSSDDDSIGLSFYEIKRYYSPPNPYVYIWYNSLDKKFYIGSTNGKTKSYTHSSSKMESFNNWNVPPYMHRRILKEFDDPKECKDFEKKLIRDRLRKKSIKYYNVYR